MFDKNFAYKYCPILAISPSETSALKELPDKDKELILPVFPLKSWATSKELSSSLEKVQNSIGEHKYWIADIDYNDIETRDPFKFKPVHHDIVKLTLPDNGYSNWCDFIKENEYLIPCVQLGKLEELKTQVSVLSSLNRGVVTILKLTHMNSTKLQDILTGLVDVDDLLVILDLEQITKEQIEYKEQVLGYLKAIEKMLPKALLSLSSTSFPDNFSGYYKGEKTIYERSLFDQLRKNFDVLIYSDRGSARASKFNGGAGTPPPRIDYSTRNSWHFIRMEFSEPDLLARDEEKKQFRKKEKKELYTAISKQMMLEPYWEKELNLWCNYIIELTSTGDDYGINSAQKATAARINKHLYTQLHYDNVEDIGDTDEDWID